MLSKRLFLPILMVFFARCILFSEADRLPCSCLDRTALTSMMTRSSELASLQSFCYRGTTWHNSERIRSLCSSQHCSHAKPPLAEALSPPPRAEHGRKILNRQAGHWVHLKLPRLSLQCAESRGAGSSGRGALAQVEEEQSSGSPLPGTIQVAVSSGSHLCHSVGLGRRQTRACQRLLAGKPST